MNQTMHAVVQEELGGKLFIKELPIPKPGKGEVLIKMFYSPINPSDLSFLQGTFAVKKKFPVVPGIEGSGIVVEAGKGILPNLRKGKRVMCSSSPEHHGTWAQYVVTSASKCIPVDDKISNVEASTLIVNPLSALAMLNIAKHQKVKAVVNTAAAGALGKMIYKLFKKENIVVINIVHKEEHIDTLKEIGAEYILNSSSEEFSESFKRLTEKNEAKLIFDAVGGKLSEKMIEFSPFGSKLISYAKLSEESMCIDNRIIVQQNKEISGFFLANWNKEQSIFTILKNIKKVKKLVKTYLQTKVHTEIKMDEINEGLKLYKENMSKGKVIINLS